MKKMLTTYAVFGSLLLLLSVSLLYLSRASGVGSALKLLGKGEKEYQLARQKLILGLHDPSHHIVAHLRNRHTSDLSRLQALKILQDLSYHQPVKTGGAEVASLIANDNHEISLQALKTYQSLTDTAGVQKIIDFFAATNDTALFQQAAAALAASAGRLFGPLTAAAAQGDSSIVDSIMGLPLFDALPMGKGPVYDALASYYQRRGDYVGGRRFNRKGLITKWWVTGGWDNRNMSAFYAALPPETTIFDPEDTWKIDDSTTAKWRKLLRLDGSHDFASHRFINLQNMFVRQLYSVAYLATYLIVPSERQALLFMGSDDGIRVWVNDSLVFTHKCFRAVFPDNDVVKVRLRAGVNRILVKVAQDVGGWGFLGRVTDLKGDGMQDLTVALTPDVESSPVTTLMQSARANPSQIANLAADLGGEDEALGERLVEIAIDHGADPAERTTALSLLTHINSRRTLPLGEEELMMLAGQLVKADATGDLIRAVFEALAGMGTSRGLELGRSALDAADPKVRLWGRILITNYCGRHLDRLENDKKVPGSEKLRLSGELLSLNPQSSTQLARLAQIYASQGDSAEADRIWARTGIASEYYFFPYATEAWRGIDEMVKPLSSKQLGDVANEGHFQKQLITRALYTGSEKLKLRTGGRNFWEGYISFVATPVIIDQVQKVLVSTFGQRVFHNGRELAPVVTIHGVPLLFSATLQKGTNMFLTSVQSPGQTDMDWKKALISIHDESGRILRMEGNTLQHHE